MNVQFADPGLADLHHRGQPARLAHRALRQQGRSADRSRSSPPTVMLGRRLVDLGFNEEIVPEHFSGQGAGVPVQQVLRRRHRSSGRRCVRPARSWAPTTTSVPRSRRHRSAPATTCRGTARSSSRCGTRTSATSSPTPRRLNALGFELIATSGTARALEKNGIPVQRRLQDQRRSPATSWT